MPSIAKKISQAWSGATPADDIATIRERISALRAERAAVEGAPVPIAEAQALLGEMLDRWSAAGAHRHLGAAPLVQAAAAGQVPFLDLHDPNTTLGMVFSVLAPVLREPLEAALHDALAVLYQDAPAGLPAAERGVRLKAIDSELFRCERDEEAAGACGHDGGLFVARRPDCDPRAVLGLD